MASASVELVRSFYAAWERGEFFERSDWAHPEIECAVVDGPTPGRGKGLAGTANLWREIIGPYEAFRVTAQEFREIDDHRILVLVKFSGRGKTSGLEIGQVQTKNACILDIEDNTVRRLALYWDREQAFADLGLSPDGDAGEPPG